MESILTTVFYQPAINFLYFFSNLTEPSLFWIGIASLVIVIKIVLVRTSVATIHMQQKMQKIQGKLQSIKERYKKDKEKLAFETIALYRDNNINPFKSILILLIQIPIVITVFFVVKNISQGKMSYDLLYSFITQPELFSTTLFGIELSTTPEPTIMLSVGTVVFALLSSFTLFMLMQQSAAHTSGESAQRVQKILRTVFPPLIAISVFWFGAAVGFYFFVNNLVSLAQEKIILSNIRKKQAKKG